MAANPDKSLDELVADKIINADQKAQILTKPSLKAKLAEAEEQLKVYKKVYSEYQEQRTAEKKQLEESLTEKHKKELEEAVAEAEAKADKKLRDSLLSISQFLAVAAARRVDDFDPDEDESRALEGCLLQVYDGNNAGVEAMLKISGASDEKTMSTKGDRLETTCASLIPFLPFFFRLQHAFFSLTDMKMDKSRKLRLPLPLPCTRLWLSQLLLLRSRKLLPQSRHLSLLSRLSLPSPPRLLPR